MWIAFSVLSVIFGAAFLVIEKRTLFNEHAMEFTAVIFFINAALSMFLVPFIDLNFPAYVLILLIISSVIESFAFLYMAKSLRHSQISGTLPLMAFVPIVTLLLAVTMLGEVFTGRQFIGMAFIVSGAYFLKLNKITHILVPFKTLYQSKSAHYILIAVILYGVASIIDKYTLEFAAPLTVIFVSSIIRFVVVLCLIYLFHDGIKGIGHGLFNFKWIFLAAFTLIMARVFIIAAMNIAPVSLVISFHRLAVLIAVFVGGKMFHEGHILHKLSASAIMLVGAYLIVA